MEWTDANIEVPQGAREVWVHYYFRPSTSGYYYEGVMVAHYSHTHKHWVCYSANAEIPLMEGFVIEWALIPEFVPEPPK